MTRSFDISAIGGVIPALITCFDEGGEYDERRQREVVRFLLRKKVHGLYVAGSTGEAFMMAPEERKRVVETVVDEAGGALPIIAHIGAISTKVSVDLARHAESCGVDAVSSVPPTYWKFSDDEIFDYYRDLTESVNIPMIVYNIELAGLVGFELIKRLSEIAGVKGIKYTATTLDEIMRIKEEIGHDFVVFSGSDQMAMSGLSFGAEGIIGSYYNMIPELFMSLFDAVKAGDLESARAKQRQANAIITFSGGFRYLSVIKRSLRWVGIEAGPPRKPFEPISAEQEVRLRSGLREIGERYDITGVDVLASL